MDEERQVIEQVLDCLGLTKTWLAEGLGISISQLSRMFSGERRWTEENQEQAARLLGWNGTQAALLFQPGDLPRQVVINARYGHAQGHVTDDELAMIEEVFGGLGDGQGDRRPGGSASPASV